MGKIKLNLVSGAVVEKPLINAFKANNNSYIVLDNEMNGSMGLPIILVCKFEGNKLIKILDQNEWSIVKEYLKNIIAGNQIEFIKVDSELAADDIYYTQLTLPVPSFDALKNAYKVEEENNVVNNMVNEMVNNEPSIQNVSVPQVETPVVDQVINQVQEPVSIEPVINPVEVPVVDIPVSPVLEPVIESTPVIEPVSPAVENTFVSPQDIVTPVMPEVENVQEPINVVEPKIDNVGEESIFKDQKEAFMQACENMFDALVQKFERELENRK